MVPPGCCALAVAAALLPQPANAALVVSSAPTANVGCTAGSCTATAADAVLNAGDLQTMLASSGVTLHSGAGARDIIIATPLGWASASTLALDAALSVLVEAPVTVSGPGGLSVILADGDSVGTLSFGRSGNVTFWDVSSPLTINGVAYTLVADIKHLQSEVSHHWKRGRLALANDVRFPKSEKLHAPPLGYFAGKLEGLGNRVFNLTMASTAAQDLALMLELDPGGEIENLNLENVRVDAAQNAAGLVATNLGVLRGISVS